MTDKVDDDFADDGQDTVEDWELLGMDSDASQDEIDDAWGNQMC